MTTRIQTWDAALTQFGSIQAAFDAILRDDPALDPAFVDAIVGRDFLRRLRSDQAVLRVTPDMRATIEEMKRALAYTTDEELLKLALVKLAMHLDKSGEAFV